MDLLHPTVWLSLIHILHLDSEGNPTNLTELDIRMENGVFKAEATGAGSVEKVLYNGSETVPTVPGSYPVTCVMKFGEGTIELPIGTLVIPEPASPSETGAPVEYRMQTSASEPVQGNGKSTGYKAPVPVSYTHLDVYKRQK